MSNDPSAFKCLVCDTPVGRHDVVVASIRGTTLRYHLCPKHQKPSARFLEAGGIAEHTFIPLPKKRSRA